MPALIGSASPSPWKFDPHLDVVLVTTLLVLAYWLALTRLGPRYAPAGQPVASRGNKIAFFLCALSLFVFAEWPIHDLAEHNLFSVHMLQHLVFTTVSAPLLLLALPPWLLRLTLVRPRAVYAVARQVTRPVVALVIFNAFLVLTHWPNVTNETTHNEPFHFGVHVVMFGTALILWMPMINSLPELPRLTYPQRIIYLFLQSIVPTIPSAYLIFASGVVYKAYLHGPQAVGISPIADQQVAGVVMKLGGGAILWGLCGYTFFKWYGEEQRRDARLLKQRAAQIEARPDAAAGEQPVPEYLPETLTWDDVAAELERTPPPRP
jgi:putative membrane protein